MGDEPDDVHAGNDVAERGVAGRCVQTRLIAVADEELRGRRVGLVGARHRDRAVHVTNAGLLGRFEHNRGIARPFVRLVAALNHEAGDRAEKRAAGVEAGIDVMHEVRDRLGRMLGIERDNDIAVGGDDLDARALARVRRVGGCGKRNGEERGGAQRGQGEKTTMSVHRCACTRWERELPLRRKTLPRISYHPHY